MLCSFCEGYHIRKIRRMKTVSENQMAMMAEMPLPDFRRTPAAWQ